ncbi:MAG: hypothetical protein WEA58_03980 [Balneolaceae bacterium]
MKLKFEAWGENPEYNIENETINDIDLSEMPIGATFIGNEETRQAGIVNAFRDESNELHVTLKQSIIASKIKGRPAHWREGDWIDSGDYDSSKCYVNPTGVSDLTEGEDYEIVWAPGIAKNEEGWTIRKIEDRDE